MEIVKKTFFRLLQVLPAVTFFLVVALTGCEPGCGVELTSVTEKPPTGNVLAQKIDVACKEKADLFIRYWEKGNQTKVFTTPVSPGKKEHVFSLLYLRPGKTYEYEIVAQNGNCESSISAVRSFTTKDMPLSLQEMVMPGEIQDTLPERFLKGFSLIARRDLPGQVYIVDARGNIVWYHTIRDAGFKVAHYTKQSTILSIVAPLSYPTSYGDEILEISLTGDTIFHLKKGEKGFDKTIHHEVFYNDAHQLVTLTLEKKIFDLSRVGGAKADTVTGDGIVILDNKGNKIWSWSVFDVIDPAADPDILKYKADWLHANGLSVDTDGNYLLSFYQSGQVWKIDARSGKLMWKIGRGGDFSFLKAETAFYESHAVHRTANGELMLFENGTNKKRSRVLAYTLDESGHKAHADLAIELPLNLYSERMGSAYYVDDTSILVCSSQAHSVSLLDKTGKNLWNVMTGFIPYRAEFIDSLPL
ncbi:aryl-sulfate sulfotransferase [Chitinophagaceae bacterium 26-R-25]|nr:aryl-sulfate sulfotransferase [Chitinophagaceae bacterium 26-R-25]